MRMVITRRGRLVSVLAHLWAVAQLIQRAVAVVVVGVQERVVLAVLVKLRRVMTVVVSHQVQAQARKVAQVAVVLVSNLPM